MGAINVALTTAAAAGAFVGAAGGPLGGASTFVGGATSILAGAALVATPLIAKDLWWPDGARENSRGVATHEYGHFELCSLMFELEGAESLTGLMMRMGDGEDSRDDDIALMLETWADTFAMQVTGGVNYITVGNTQDSGAMSYCTSSPCMDINHNGVNDYDLNDPFDDEHARWETLVHDAFDRADDNNRLTNNVANGDYWESVASSSCPNGSSCLQFASNSYLANDDEPVSLPGSAWITWVDKFLDRSRGGEGFFSFEYVPTSDNLIGGLTDAMREHGANWCDACEVVAMYSPAVSSRGNMRNASATRDFATRYDRWLACQEDSELRGFVGAPDREDMNIDLSCNACDALEFIDLNDGLCKACPSNSVPRPLGEVNTGSNAAPGTGGRCRVCADGSVPTSANTCNACESDEITSGGVCVACEPGLHPNGDATQCIPCSIDDVKDWTDTGASACVRSLSASFQSDSATDTCPDQFVVRFDNLNTEQTDGVSLRITHGDTLSKEVCEQTTSEGVAYQEEITGAFTQLGAFPLTAGNGQECNTNTPECNNDPALCLICDTCTLSTAATLSGAQVTGSGSSVIVAARGNGPGAIDVDITLGSQRSQGTGCGPK